MSNFRLVQLSSYAQYIYFSETESLNIGERINICEVEQLAIVLEEIIVSMSPLLIIKSSIKTVFITS